MPELRDAEDVTWSVRRRWWPLDMASSGSSASGVVMFVIALPVLLAWPVVEG